MSASIEKRVGKMRHRLIFEYNKAPRNESGGFGEEWREVVTVWGNLEPVGRGSERFDPEWTTTATAYTATIRYRDDLDEKMRIKFGTRVFMIRQIPQVSRNDDFMEITCEEVKS